MFVLNVKHLGVNFIGIWSVWSWFSLSGFSRVFWLRKICWFLKVQWQHSL